MRNTVERVMVITHCLSLIILLRMENEDSVSEHEYYPNREMSHVAPLSTYQLKTSIKIDTVNMGIGSNGFLKEIIASKPFGLELILKLFSKVQLALENASNKNQGFIIMLYMSCIIIRLHPSNRIIHSHLINGVK